MGVLGCYDRRAKKTTTKRLKKDISHISISNNSNIILCSDFLLKLPIGLDVLQEKTKKSWSLPQNIFCDTNNSLLLYKDKLIFSFLNKNKSIKAIGYIHTMKEANSPTVLKHVSQLPFLIKTLTLKGQDYFLLGFEGKKPLKIWTSEDFLKPQTDLRA